jgi:large subunit ribosomal protein LP2
MRYIASYLLANLGGVEQPNVADMSKILSSIGVACEETQAQAVVAEMNGKAVAEVIAAGGSKLATVSVGGGAAPAAAAPAAAGKKEEAKKAEAKKEESEEEMGFGLFD